MKWSASILSILFCVSAPFIAADNPHILASKQFADWRFRVIEQAKKGERPGVFRARLIAERKQPDGKSSPAGEAILLRRSRSDQGPESRDDWHISIKAFAPENGSLWLTLDENPHGSANYYSWLYVWTIGARESDAVSYLGDWYGSLLEINPSDTGNFALLYHVVHDSVACCGEWWVVNAKIRRQHLLWGERSADSGIETIGSVSKSVDDYDGFRFRWERERIVIDEDDSVTDIRGKTTERWRKAGTLDPIQLKGWKTVK